MKEEGCGIKGRCSGSWAAYMINTHHSETNYSLMSDTAADEMRKQNRSPSSEGAKKQTAVEGEYNCFTITPFHLCILCTAKVHHLAISTCENGCIICTISPY